MTTNDPRHTLSGLVTGGLDELSPGRLLGGNYHLIEPIGRGGMGQVWKAQDRAGQRIVAIKLLPPELRNHEDAIQQVRESFQKVHALTHQHIGKSLAMLSDANYGPFIVMDLVLGIPLSRYAKQYRQRNGQIPSTHVVDLLKPVAQALDYAHARGVLHRDVKPENILVQTEPHFEVTLIDFGLAATIRSTMTRFTQAPSDTRGTRPYMSPEQLRGNSRQWDGRTDQYSLAVVAYELLGGYLPFETDDDFALMYAVLNEPVVPIETCSEAVNQVLSKGLGKERTQRYENCVSFVDSFSSAKMVGVRVAEPQRDEAPSLVQSFVSSVGMELTLIPAGTFLIGSPWHEKGRRDDELYYSVTLTQPYYLSKTVVTQGQWQSIMRTTPWKGKDYVKEGENFPATYVSWYDAVEFSNKLSAKEGVVYRLPTEAEWERACRGFTTTAYNFGDTAIELSKHGWWGGRHGNCGTELYAHEVGLKLANAFGLYDMHGNVWEWCSDWYGACPTVSAVDPRGAREGSARVYRGGGWFFDAADCRSAYRNSIVPSFCSSNVGFRLALSSATGDRLKKW
jgi:formylglycine-generating enzyme required for sulfatase activity